MGKAWAKILPVRLSPQRGKGTSHPRNLITTKERKMMLNMWNRIRSQFGRGTSKNEVERGEVVLCINNHVSPEPDPGFRPPPPGTAEEAVYRQLVSQVARKGKGVFPEDRVVAKKLAKAVQAVGHRSQIAIILAEQLGLDPRYLPWKKS